MESQLPKFITKVCKKHGETEFVLEGRGYYRCKKCRSEAVTRRRKKVKLKAIEYKGGACERCGYNKCYRALEFHHTDPTKKDFGIAYKGYTRSWEKVKEELDKCLMLCANCHAEEHERLDNLEINAL
jgi:hypothetical protein